MVKNDLREVFKLKNTLKIFFLLAIDRPIWALFLGSIFFSIIDLTSIIDGLICLLLCIILEFYIVNISSEWKTYINTRDVRIFLKKDIEKYRLFEISLAELEEILGVELVSYVDKVTNLKKKYFKKIRPNAEIPVIDTFKIFCIKNKPFFTLPTAYAASSSGLSLIFLKYPLSINKNLYQKFLLLHELGHITHLENLFDKKRAIERSFSAIIATILILFFCNNVFAYLILFFLFFRIGNMFSPTFQAQNEAHNDFFAYKNLKIEEFEAVYSVLNSLWNDELKSFGIHKGSKTYKMVLREFELETRLKVLNDFKNNDEIRNAIHLSQGEGCLSEWGLGLFCLIIGNYFVYDYRVFYLLSGLIIALFIANTVLRKMTNKINKKIMQMINFASIDF